MSASATRVGFSHVLLDIEGTTCPVAFVAETLFPYARSAIPEYLERHRHDPAIAALIRELKELWITERGEPSQPQETEFVRYTQELIDHDRKVAPLKELQGLIWEEGYRKGNLKAPLFGDVATTLRLWHRRGIVLAVYSSGSIKAQQLIYRHSTEGDLTPLFSHWFDTRTGNKKEASSYAKIAHAMKAKPGQILFISDSHQELQAAVAAGMKTLFSDREGNPDREAGGHDRLRSLAELTAGC